MHPHRREGICSRGTGGSTLVRDLVARLQLRTTDPEGRSLLDHVLAAERAHQDAFARALIHSGPPGSPTSFNSKPVVSQGEQFDQALAASWRTSNRPGFATARSPWRS